jgi:hypothetical protein
MAFEDQILKAIHAAMPAGALIQVVPGEGCLNVGVSWKLNDDPERPSKMSKTISITVSHEAAQDFANISTVDHGASFDRVAAFLTQRLAYFDPTHNTSRYARTPVEKWIINTALVNG